MHPQPRVQMKKAHEHSHHGHTGNHPAFPAQWFYGLLRALPGDQACLTPSPALLIADLTPALGRQNDTTWPYASALFVNCAAASTASRPASVTIAKRPSEGRDGRGYTADLGRLASEISEFRKFSRSAFFVRHSLRGPAIHPVSQEWGEGFNEYPTPSRSRP